MKRSILSVIVLAVLVIGCGTPETKHGLARCVLDCPTDAPASAAANLDSTMQGLAEHLRANGVQCSISGYDSRWLYIQSDHKSARVLILSKMENTPYMVKFVDWDFAEQGAEGDAVDRAP